MVTRGRLIELLKLAVERLEMNNIQDSEQEFIDEINQALKQEQSNTIEERDSETGFINYYECPACGKDWADEWSCAVDDECPHCGERHISPFHSEEVGEG